MSNKVEQFNEKLDHVKRFLQETERLNPSEEVRKSFKKEYSRSKIWNQNSPTFPSINWNFVRDLQTIKSHLGYISKTIIGIYKHDEQEREPYNFESVTEIMMDFIKAMPTIQKRFSPQVHPNS